MIANIRRIAAAAIAGISLLATTIVLAQAKPEYDMGRMQLTLLYAQGGAADAAATRAHADALRSLIESGKAAASGPVAEGGLLREVILIKLDKPEEAAAIIAELPLVKSGALRPENVTWFAARNLVKPVMRPAETTRYVMGMLVAGPATGHSPEELKQIQAGHMAHIGKMAETGKLVIAGPLPGAGTRRGIYLFKLNSFDEAQILAADDPAFKSGRLKMETFYWTVPTGIFP